MQPGNVSTVLEQSIFYIFVPQTLASALMGKGLGNDTTLEAAFRQECEERFKREIDEAVSLGRLIVRDQITDGPRQSPTPMSVVRLDELNSYLAATGRGFSVQAEEIRPVKSPQQHLNSEHKPTKKDDVTSTQKKVTWCPTEKYISLKSLPSKLTALACGPVPGEEEGEEAYSLHLLDADRYFQGFDSAIESGVIQGALPIRDPKTHERLSPEKTDNAVVSIEDLQKYLKRSNSEIELVLSVNTSTPLQGSGDSEDVSRYASAEEMHRYQQRLVQLADDHLAEQEVFCETGIGLEVAGTSPLAMEHEESGGLPNALPLGLTTAPRPLQRSAAQDAKILTALKCAGHDPKALPNPGRGRPGAKAQAKQALKNDPLFAGTTVFDKAWERLRAEGAIADAC